MNTADFIKAYEAPRNGANRFYYHAMVRSFEYSDGVGECAQAGLYWLLDIAATELPKKIRASGGYQFIFTVSVLASKASLSLLDISSNKEIWGMKLNFADMPDGDWKFFIADEIERVAMILPSEY